MFNSLARLDAFRRHDRVPVLPFSNDNRGRARLPAGAELRQRLACYWHPNAETGGLQCQWELSSHSGAEALEQSFPVATEPKPAGALRVA
jgi:hypothetical protein